jgi:hypothetical protein
MADAQPFYLGICYRLLIAQTSLRLTISRIPSAGASFSLALSFGKRYHTVRMAAFMMEEIL